MPPAFFRENRTHIIIALALIVALAAFLAISRPAGSTYLDPAGRFSIAVPPGIAVQDLPATIGPFETLEIGGATGEYVQVFISPWNGPDALTSESLAGEFPSLEMDGDMLTPAQVAGATAVAFTDRGTGLRNLWFASGGQLYQAVDYDGDGTLLNSIAAGWTFL